MASAPTHVMHSPYPYFAMSSPRKTLALASLSALALLAFAPTVKAVNLDEACAKFAAKISEAQASGNAEQVKTVYSKGSQRIASKFNGATCPNVKAP